MKQTNTYFVDYDFTICIVVTTVSQNVAFLEGIRSERIVFKVKLNKTQKIKLKQSLLF